MRKILTIKATAEAAHDFFMLLQNSVKTSFGSEETADGNALNLHKCRIASGNSTLQDFAIAPQLYFSPKE